jgi:hypothetical protein
MGEDRGVARREAVNGRTFPLVPGVTGVIHLRIRELYLLHYLVERHTPR